MSESTRRFLLCLMIFVIGLLYFVMNLFSPDPDIPLRNGESAYRRGLQAETLAERELAFNEALEIYSGLEKEHDLRYGNGKVYGQISQCYEQLGLDAFAKLYRLREKDQTIPHLLQGYFGMGVLAAFMGSFWIWRPRFWIKWGTGFFGVGSLFFFSLAIYFQFFTPILGVVVKNTPTYTSPSLTSAKVDGEELISGVVVETLAIESGGKWVKIQSGNRYGYIPQDRVRLQ